MRMHVRLPGLHGATRLACEEDGSNLLEMAITIGLLLCLMMGIVGMSEFAYARHFVTFSARQGTRYAMVRGSTFASVPCSSGTAYNCQASASAVSSYVKSQVPLGLSPSNLTVATSWSGLAGSGLGCLLTNGANSPGCVVQVKVSYAFSFALPYLPAGAMTIQSTSSASILQ